MSEYQSLWKISDTWELSKKTKEVLKVMIIITDTRKSVEENINKDCEGAGEIEQQ